MFRIGKFIEIKIKLVVSWGLGSGENRLNANEYGVSFQCEKLFGVR